MLRFFLVNPIDKLALKLALALAICNKIQGLVLLGENEKPVSSTLPLPTPEMTPSTPTPRDSNTTFILGIGVLIAVLAACVLACRRCLHEPYHAVDEEAARIDARTREREADERAGLSL